MRLNLDCIRDTLLCVEDNTGLRKFCIFVDIGLNESMEKAGMEIIPPRPYQEELLRKYSSDELIYHVNYCVEADLLTMVEGSSPYKMLIADLTPKGHEFLGKIRNGKVWSKVKSIAEKMGVKTLESVFSIAANVVGELVKSQF